MSADDYDNKRSTSNILQKEWEMRGKEFLTICTYKKIQTCMFMYFQLQGMLNPEL